MNDTKKPREFWIKGPDKTKIWPYWDTTVAGVKPIMEPDFLESIHVIEKSAYEELKVKLDDAQEYITALRGPPNCTLPATDSGWLTPKQAKELKTQCEKLAAAIRNIQLGVAIVFDEGNQVLAEYEARKAK